MIRRTSMDTFGGQTTLTPCDLVLGYM